MTTPAPLTLDEQWQVFKRDVADHVFVTADKNLMKIMEAVFKCGCASQWSDDVHRITTHRGDWVSGMKSFSEEVQGLMEDMAAKVEDAKGEDR